MNAALSSPDSKADTALSVPEQENQQASHIGLSWTARHDPTMPRQCGYALSVPKPTKVQGGFWLESEVDCGRAKMGTEGVHMAL